MSMIRKTVETLLSLAQLDRDAAIVYEQALAGVDDPKLALQLASFKADHEMHAEALARLMSRIGEVPPDVPRDLKGYVIQGMTAVSSAFGPKGALMAMRANELLTNRMYQAVSLAGLDAEIAMILQRHREDERRHLEALEQRLEEAPWRSPEVPFIRRHPPTVNRPREWW